MPEIVEVDNSQDVGISYHPGYNDEPIRIHLKKEKAIEGEHKYEDLLISNILSPSINQKLPLPLLKIEIPDCVIVEAKPYKPKTGCVIVDVVDSNVVEFFIAYDGFTGTNFFEKYRNLVIPYFMMSFEFLASYSVLSDYQKTSNYVPKNGAAERIRFVHSLKGMELCISHFSDNSYTKLRNKIALTFIENKYSEDIILNTLLKHSKGDMSTGTAALKNLQVLPLTQPTVLSGSIAEECLRSNQLSAAEKDELKKRAISARYRLSQAIFDYNREFEIKRNKLEMYANKFISIITFLHTESLHRFDCNGQNISSVTDFERWHLLAPDMHAQEIHMLFAKFMGKDYCRLRRHIICSTRYNRKSKEEHNIVLRSHPEIMFMDKVSDDLRYLHDWLEFDDMFEVDLLKPTISKFLGEGDKYNNDIVFCCMPRFCNDDWNGLIPKMRANGYVCESIRGGTVNADEFEAIFRSRNKLLQRVYDDIVAHIN